MSEIKLSEFQAYLADKYGQTTPSTGLFMKLVEEVGEVAEALNQLEGRKQATADSSLAHELADVLHYAVAIASRHDIDLTQAILEKDQIAVEKYQHRVNLQTFLATRN